MTTGRSESMAIGSRTATIEVLGEGLRAAVPIPEEGVSAGELLRTAGVAVRETGWDLFVNGARTTADHRVSGTEDATLSYSPRTRGA